MTSETVIYEFSGVTLNEEKLYKRVVSEKSITITEKQFDEAWERVVERTGTGCSFAIWDIKKELGF